MFLATSPLTPLIRAAGGPARPQLLLLCCFLSLNLSACVFECEGLINVVSIPFYPITPAPLEGRLAGQPLTPPPPPPPPLSRAESAVVMLPVFMRCKSRCSPKDLLWLFFFFFALPLSFKHVTGAELGRLDSCPGPRQLLAEPHLVFTEMSPEGCWRR